MREQHDSPKNERKAGLAHLATPGYILSLLSGITAEHKIILGE